MAGLVVVIFGPLYGLFAIWVIARGGMARMIMWPSEYTAY